MVRLQNATLSALRAVHVVLLLLRDCVKKSMRQMCLKARLAQASGIYYVLHTYIYTKKEIRLLLGSYRSCQTIQYLMNSKGITTVLV